MLLIPSCEEKRLGGVGRQHARQILRAGLDLLAARPFVGHRNGLPGVPGRQELLQLERIGGRRIRGRTRFERQRASPEAREATTSASPDAARRQDTPGRTPR